MIPPVKTKSFHLRELFDIDNLWIYGKNKQWETRFAEATSKSLPVISGITTNNGVNYYTEDTPNKDEVFADALTISTRGEYSGTVTYHEGSFVLANNILVMQMPGWSLRAKLYIATLISKLGYGGYSGYPRKETLKNDKVTLPVKENEEIDFDYMEARIRELEEARIRELEEALRVMGLHDTKLTEDEKNALVKNIPTHNFLIKDICDVTYGNKFDKNKMSHANPNVNFVSRTANNNGISDKVDLIQGVEPYSAGLVTLALGGSVGSCFIQDSPFYTGQNVGVLNFPSYYTREAKLYIVCVLSKKCKATYTAFADEINKHLKTDLSIDLPVKNSTGTIDSIDYNYMHNYIRAIEKLTIQKLYDDKGIFIDKAKKVCS